MTLLVILKDVGSIPIIKNLIYTISKYFPLFCKAVLISLLVTNLPQNRRQRSAVEKPTRIRALQGSCITFLELL